MLRNTNGSVALQNRGHGVRFFFFALAVLAALLATGTPAGMIRPLQAQDEDEEKAGEGQPAAQGSEKESESKTDTPDNMLEYYFKALGWSYTIVFLVLSFMAVALFVMNLISARRDSVCPPQLIEGFEAHLSQGQYQEAYELARSDESFLGQVLSAGLAKISSGYPQAIEAMQEVGEEENMKLEHRLSYMALIGTISPMVGLFGTVDGMIRSFRVIAQSTTTPPPSELAEGIATALVTTIVGLAIAIPTIAAYNILKNRVQRLVLEVGIRSEELMSHFQQQKAA